MAKVQKAELYEIEKTSNLIVEYDIPTAVIEDMAKRFAPLEITDMASYKAVISAIAEVRVLRVTVEKKRVELKREALEYGRKVDSEAKRITSMLTPIEEDLKAKKQVEDDRKEAERQEKIRIEQERVGGIRKKIADIQRLSMGLQGMNSSELYGLGPEVDKIEINQAEYSEFVIEAKQALGDVKNAISKAYSARVKFEEEETARKAEAERLEQVRLEQEAEAKRLAGIQANFEAAQRAEEQRQADTQAKIDAERKAEQDLIDAERRKIQAERQKFEAEKKAEQDRKDREALEARLKEEARVNAEREAREKAHREEANRVAREKAEAEEKARQEAIRPDKEKVVRWGNELLNTTPPTVLSEECIALTEQCLETVYSAARDMIQGVESL